MKAKTKFTRLWSILLVLVMVVGMLPTVALAAGAATADFSADPTAALALLNAAKTADAEDSTWDSTTKTLTLKGVNFVTTAATAVILPAGTTIVLADGTTNTITGGNSTTEDTHGIKAKHSLSIQGTGTLNVTGGTAGDHSFGICTLDGDLVIWSGNVKAKGGEAKVSSNGLWAGKTSWEDPANLAIVGGVVEAEGGRVTNTDGVSSGIYANRYIFIRNAGTIVTATGGTAQNYSFGIYAYGGKVQLYGGTLTAASKGTRCINGTVNVNDSGFKTISFESNNGGTGDMEARTTAETYTLPENGFTAPEGKQFKGWSVNGTEKAVGDKITVSANTTVKAVWENIPVTYYTVTFDSAGGSAVTAQTIEAGQKATKPANPTKDGFDFKGWNLNGSAYDFNTAVNGNITLVATWEQKQVAPTTYTVSFAANGGTGTMADVTGVSGTYTLPENGFTAPEGKQFKAWSVDGKDKAVGDKITVTADTTVTAVWENIPAAPTEYNILDGANSSWTQDSDGNLSVRGSGAFSEFVGVKVDGKSVDEKYYTVKEGSTIVTLKADYLNTLTGGNHTLEIIWTDGSASTAFTVNAKAVVDNDTKSPQTGDNSMMALWIAVLFVSGIGVMGTTIYIRKKKYSVK